MHSQSPVAFHEHSPLDSLARSVSQTRSRHHVSPLVIEHSRFDDPTLLAGPPTSPLLHSGFRSSVATSAYEASYRVDSYYDSPPSPLVYQTPDSPSPHHSFLDPSVSYRLPLQSPSSTLNYSRPRAPQIRSPDSEQAKKHVLQRIKLSRSAENLPLHVSTGSASSSPSRSPLRHDVSKDQLPMQHTPPLSHTSHPNSSPQQSSLTLSSMPVPKMSPASEKASSFSQSISANSLPITPSSPQPNGSKEVFDSSYHEAPYDRYSFYELPSPVPSPVSPKFLNTLSPSSSSASENKMGNLGSTPESRHHDPPNPEGYLTLGIQSHLSGSAQALNDSARYFQLAATLKGGCSFGMLMWGLCLRHGWGVKKDETQAFSWLRRACELALKDLEYSFEPKSNHEKTYYDSDLKNMERPELTSRIKPEVRAELVLAIYEVGQSFFHGWGVTQDRVMGFNYFLVAARLGDVDAQQELGYCYLNGKGCKKDRKEAARWYRAAVTQGASTVGLAWIFKDKYN